MKRKFLIAIHDSGSLNDAVVRILTNHAKGEIEADFELLEALARSDYANWTTIRSKYTLSRNAEDGSLDIYEGEKHTMTIYEKIYSELKETEQEIEDEMNSKDDIKNVL